MTTVQVSTPQTWTLPLYVEPPAFVGPPLPRCVECGGTDPEWLRRYAGAGLWDGSFCSDCFFALKETVG